MQLHTAGLVVIKDRKLLLAFSNNKQAFYLPGGKMDGLETAREALTREIREELGIDLAEERLTWYTHISAPAYGETNGTIMEQECFTYELSEEPIPSAEIGPIAYFDTYSYSQQTAQAPGVVQLLLHLKNNGLVD